MIRVNLGIELMSRYGPMDHINFTGKRIAMYELLGFDYDT